MDLSGSMLGIVENMYTHVVDISGKQLHRREGVLAGFYRSLGKIFIKNKKRRQLFDCFGTRTAITVEYVGTGNME